MPDINLSDFRHRVPIQIRFNDIDPLGHVNNAVQLTYYDLGKLHYLRAAFGGEPDFSADTLVVVHTEADYFNPIFLHSPVEVLTKVRSTGEKSVELWQTLANPHDQTVYSACLTLMSGYNRIRHESVAIPNEWKKCFDRMEGE